MRLGDRDSEASADTIRKRFYRWKRKYIVPLVTSNAPHLLALRKYALEKNPLFAENFYRTWTPLFRTNNRCSVLSPSLSHILEVIDATHDAEGAESPNN